MEDDSFVDAVLADTKEKMAKAIAHSREDFATVRTGRASPALIEKLKVDYYGTEVPLQQIAGITMVSEQALVFFAVSVAFLTRHLREEEAREQFRSFVG